MELDVSDGLYQRLSERAERNGFDSPEEYSVVVLETVITELDRVAEGSDEEEVKHRLEDLGYLE